MKARYKIFIALLLCLSMIISLGTSGVGEEISPREEDVFLGDELSEDSEESLEEGKEEDSIDQEENSPGEDEEDSNKAEEDETLGETEDSLEEEEGPEEDKDLEIGEREDEEEIKEKNSLIINHILLKNIKSGDGELEEAEELIHKDIFEDMEIGSKISKESLKLDSENYAYIKAFQGDYIVGAGENTLNLYYKLKIEWTELRIHHILKDGQHEELGMTEIIEDLKVGMLIPSSEYIFKEGSLIFLESSIDQILLEPGENNLELYYKLSLEKDYIVENPDFELEEGEEIISPEIFIPQEGSLGPFKRINKGEKEILENYEKLEKLKKTGSSKILENPQIAIGLGEYEDEINNIAWPRAGSIYVNKTASQIEGSGNKWEINLEVRGKDLIETSDLVLVMDRSASMAGEKLEEAKEMGRTFINSLLEDPERAHIRIALVSFAGDIRVDSNFKDYGEKDELLRALDSIEPRGGTHLQAGIKQAHELLRASEADHKNIILLGDGAASYSFQIPSAEEKSEDWYSSGSGLWFDPIIKNYRTTSEILEDDFIYSFTVGRGRGEYSLYKQKWKKRYYYRHGASAIAQAGFAKDQGIQIYTLGLGSGDEGAWTLENIGNSDKYYKDPEREALEGISQEIKERLITTSTRSNLIESLGEHYSILGIDSENYQDLIEISQGELSYNSEKKTISWHIGDINETKAYTMKYQVALDYSVEGGSFYPLNDKTYIDYKNIDGKEAKKYLPLIEFRLRALNLSQRLEGDEDEEFDLILEGPAGESSKTWSVSLKNNEVKTIKGLIPGSYTIKETVPMNYKTSKAQELIIGEYDWNLSHRISNRKNNYGWFHHVDKLIKSFKIGNITRLVK